MINKSTKLFGVTMLATQVLNAAPPNIVFVLVDDLGTGWTSPYASRLTVDDIEPEVCEWYARERGKGMAVSKDAHLTAAQNCMPFLSKLAADGAVFTRCFSSANLCAPSRAGLLTGTFQQRWGAYANLDITLFGLPGDKALLSESLHAAGYQTGMIGKWHVSRVDPALKGQAGGDTSCLDGEHPLDRGFDYYFGYNSHAISYYESKDLWENRTLLPARPAGEFLTDLLSEKACEFLLSSLSSHQPVFLYYAPMTVHGPLVNAPSQYTEPFKTGIPFSDNFAGHLLALDSGIEQIFQTLETSGQLTNTLFIFSADNGCSSYNVPPQNAPNRGGKGNGWLGGLNVPLIVWDPGRVLPGYNDEIVSLCDVMPTLLDAASAPVPDGIDGKSLWPFLCGDSENGPRDSLGSTGLHASHWSYFYEAEGEINNSDAERSPLYTWMLYDNDMLLTRISETPSGLYEKLPDGLPSRTLLHDLSADRHQRVDLSDKMPERVKESERDISRWVSEMKPPLRAHLNDYQWLLGATRDASGLPSSMHSSMSVSAEGFFQDFQSGTSIYEYTTTGYPFTNRFSGISGGVIAKEGANQFLRLTGNVADMGFWRAGRLAGNDLCGAPLSSMKVTMDVNFSGFTARSFSFVIGSGFAHGVGTGAAVKGQEIFGRLLFSGSSSGWTLNGAAGADAEWQKLSVYLNDTGNRLTYSAPDGVLYALEDRRYDVWLDQSRVSAGAAAEEEAALLSNMKLGIGMAVPGVFSIDNIVIESIQDESE
ncbi:sulfatase family protein [Tichowtungia aerotolerans]|uniref:Sulfatase-like hydrolase/transferase n=1 Tax=Tichowtungia aerotolerans TaxID=2697043 RepID=A0A6P1MDN6_9BACT|nr:sulfatase-like hydrolase/transferase [Tichowtungia aerotolerans]QHI69215.1 sulfatase-like hydrolase/transferase [Tichowtungia aerotolerans]